MTARGFIRLVAAVVCGLGLMAAGAVQAAEMTFHTVQLSKSDLCGRGCVQVIAAEGEITDNTPEAFVAYASNLDSTHARNVLFLDSPGGNVVGSLQFGKVLRRLGTTVVVARVLTGPYGEDGVVAGGRCMSACVYSFMGGSRRVVPPQSMVGIHRMFRKEQEYDFIGRSTSTKYIYAPDAMVAALAHYSDSMGIGPGLVARAETIAPQSVHIVTRSELRRWHLGTTRF